MSQFSVIYRPNSNGGYGETHVVGGSYYSSVNEETYDGYESGLYEDGTSFTNTTVNFTNPTTRVGRIKNIILHTICARQNTVIAYSKGAIYYPGQSLQYGAQNTPIYKAPGVNTNWSDFSDVWATNPWTGLPWTWANLDLLQIGVALKGTGTYYAFCTQVYIIVNSATPSPRGAQMIGPTW